jgi:hypothetical protein
METTYEVESINFMMALISGEEQSRCRSSGLVLQKREMFGGRVAQNPAMPLRVTDKSTAPAFDL